jgi:cytokinesis protein
MVLINGIMDAAQDLDVRLHHRSQMESAGLQRVLALMHSFGVPPLDKLLKIFETTIEEDELRLRERLDQEVLKDLTNPEDVFKALAAKTSDSKARDYFLSMMQHLLLIREEGSGLVHYYQLIDSIVSDVVLDKKLAGAEQRIGHSVERIIAQFNEADRFQTVEDEATEARAMALRLKLEKEALEEEIAQGTDGLVGQLKRKVAHLEEKLKHSRDTTVRLQGQMEAQKDGYEEQIAQLEAQIMELFRMLKEVGKGVEKIFENSGGMDRKTLIETLETHLQRNKTINILEGKDKKRRRPGKGQQGFDDSDVTEEDEDEANGAQPSNGSLKRRPNSTIKGRSKSTKSVRASEGPNGRASQFMDADDAEAQEQIEQQLAAGVGAVSPFFCYRRWSLIKYSSTPLHLVLPLEVSEDHQGAPVTVLGWWKFRLPWLAHRTLRHLATKTVLRLV